MAQVVENLTYEQAFMQLEQILQTLERGDLPLEQALGFYEEGVALAAYCGQKLDEAELRVSRWQPGHQTTPLTGWQEG